MRKKTFISLLFTASIFLLSCAAVAAVIIHNSSSRDISAAAVSTQTAPPSPPSPPSPTAERTPSPTLIPTTPPTEAPTQTPAPAPEISLAERYGVMTADLEDAAEYPNVTAEAVLQTDGNYFLAAAYPKTDSESINDLIIKALKAELSAFRKELSAIGAKGVLDVRYKIYEYNEHVKSIAFEFRSWDSAQGSAYSKKAAVFDFLSGARLGVNQIFSGKRYLDVIQKRAYLFPFDETLPDSVLPLYSTKADFGSFAFDSKYFYIFAKTGGRDMTELFFPLAEFGQDFAVERHIRSHFAENAAEPQIPPDDGTKYVAITFDDGPHSEYTAYILDVLKQYNAKATFFVLGHRVAENADLIRRMVEEGHEIGNHSYSHKELPALSRDGMAQEIDRTRDAVFEAANYEMRVMRPPYGAKNSALRSVMEERGLSVILWDVDPLDWATRERYSVYNAIMRQTKDGGIILVHDIYESSVKGAELAIKALSEQGYVFVTVSDLIRIRTGYDPLAGEIYNRLPSQAQK